MIAVDLAAVKMFKQRTTDTGDAAAAEWRDDSQTQATSTGLLQHTAPSVLHVLLNTDLHCTVI